MQIPSTIYGQKIYLSQDIPRMTLMPEIIPGVVGWPPGFKEEIDAWMLGFFGSTNIIDDGQVLQSGQALHMNQRTYRQLMAATQAKEQP